MDNLAFLVPNNFKAIDIVQIVIIFFALYELVKSLKNTRAWQLLKGIIFLVLATFISKFLNGLFSVDAHRFYWFLFVLCINRHGGARIHTTKFNERYINRCNNHVTTRTSENNGKDWHY